MPTEDETDHYADGKYRVFCAYPQHCGAETFVDSEQDAVAAVDAHEEKNPTHAADYERWDDTETEGENHV